MEYPKTVGELINIREIPVVVIDHNGMITFINDMFEKEYGWRSVDLVGNSVTMIMPPQFHELHQIGFSKFLASKRETIMGKPIALSVVLKNRTIKQAAHYILGEEKDGVWNFAALIIPLPNAN